MHAFLTWVLSKKHITLKRNAHSYRIIDTALLTAKIVISQAAEIKLPKLPKYLIIFLMNKSQTDNDFVV